MGSQHTLHSDTRDRDHLARELLQLASRVTARLRAADKVGRTVAITIRWSDFRTITRSRTLPEPTDVTDDVYQAALLLLADVFPLRMAVRLVGLRVEGLRPRRELGSRQLVIGERDPGWPDADRAVDRATARFGSSAVRRGSLIR
jgi:DNA polymerase-4